MDGVVVRRPHRCSRGAVCGDAAIRSIRCAIVIRRVVVLVGEERDNVSLGHRRSGFRAACCVVIFFVCFSSRASRACLCSLQFPSVVK